MSRGNAPLLALSAVACACNGVLGIGEAELDPLLADAGGGGGGSAGNRPVEASACAPEGILVCGVAADGTTDQAALFCDQGHYAKVFQCPGIQTCIDSTEHAFVACGSPDLNLPFAKEGAPCSADQAGACSFDAAQILECTSGTWALSRHCAPSRCANVTTSSGARSLACENGGYALGDHCAFAAGKVVCSVDLGAVLSCSGGTTIVKEQCAAGAQCTDVNGSLGCR